jgi:hypothetical protein
MAPLIVSALVGIGVKIVTDLFMSGAKEVMKPNGPAATFAATLDKARSATGAAATPGAKSTALDLGFGDRSRVMAADVGSALPGAARAQAVASYRRLDEIAPQAI